MKCDIERNLMIELMDLSLSSRWAMPLMGLGGRGLEIPGPCGFSREVNILSGWTF